MWMYISNRRYGRVDIVPGICYVVTEFVCCWGIPILPRHSAIVGMRGSPVTRRGLLIPLSAKSTLFTYVRSFCIFVTLVAFLGMLGSDTQGHHAIAGPLAYIGGSAVLFVTTLLLRFASKRRAEQLIEIINSPETRRTQPDGYKIMAVPHGPSNS